MWCSRVRNQLSAYIDGELSPAAARAVETHLAQCERCSGEQVQLRSIVRLAGLAPEEEVPSSLHSRIMTRLAYADAPSPVPAVRESRLFFRNPWAAAALTGAAAAIALGIIVTQAEGQRGTAGPVRAVKSQEAPRACPAPRKEEARKNETGDAAEVVIVTRERRSRKAAPAPEREQPAAVAKDTTPAAAELKPAKVEAAPERPLRVAKAAPPARDARAKPARELVAGKPSPESRATEPEAPKPAAPEVTVAREEPKAGNAPAGQTEPAIMMEREGTTRMAGGTVEPATSGQEDEGLRQLRMFFDERNQSVPQPPLLQGRDRMMRKPL